MGHSSPQRIASLLSSATEMLYALGAGDRVVAVSHECDYPPQVRFKPRVTFSHVDPAADSPQIDQQVRQLLAAGEPLYSVDREQLEALCPELIVTQSQCDVCAVRYADVAALVQSSPVLRQAVLVDLNPRSLEDVLADMQRLGQAVGISQQADDVVGRLRQRIAAITDRTAGRDEAASPRVAFVEWIQPLMLGGNWMPELIAMAGGRPSYPAQAGHPSEYSTWEAFCRSDPDVIVIAPCGFDLQRTTQEAQRLRTWPGWQQLAAVRKSRVYVCDGNAYFNRSGPRLVDSLEMLAHLIEPSVFAPPAGPRAWAAFC